MWLPEQIPDSALLYMRVHRNDLDPTGRPQKGAFRDRGARPDGLETQASEPPAPPGMSTDWEKYSTARDTLERGPQGVSEYAVVSLDVGRVRLVPAQRVEHTPKAPDPLHPNPKERSGNRAHTDVFGDKRKNPEVRTKLRAIAEVVIARGEVETVPH